MFGDPPASSVFEPMKSRRGTLRCKICHGVVPRMPIDEVAYLFWEGRKHLVIHTWPCTDCDRAFTSAPGLSKHRRAAHP